VVDPSSNHNLARKLHEGDTGRWLIDSPAYLDWYKYSGRLFWLYGIAGAGKTVLCSTVIEDVKRRIEADAKGDEALGYFYFDFQNTTKQNTSSLIRTLIRQLCSSRSMSWTRLTSLYVNASRGGQQPAESVLLDLLIEVAKGMEKTFIILDAFDECTEKEDAIDTILRLFNRLYGKANIFITSRYDTYIENGLSEVDTACLTKTAAKNAAVDKDISEYVKARMEKDRKLSRWKGQTKHIVENLVHQADGM
jgi:NACHT domain